ncbi:hypothetical protein GJAV_G00087690 [Gymnothorax javanicus]|nr:hypothetical protein GJAV_G00087690 [Gymnothorax javanicus]
MFSSSKQNPHPRMKNIAKKLPTDDFFIRQCPENNRRSLRDAYVRDPELCRVIGLSILLKSDALPTVFDYSSSTGSSSISLKTMKNIDRAPRSASKKRRHREKLHFYTHSIRRMMQAGVRLRQDTETTLPELPEQHRIREKEEELHGLESVHMAESETKCTKAGLNTVEPECVTANSRVSDLHHTEASLIKTETDLSPTHSGVLKMESPDSTELGYLHPGQIKTETDDGGYLKAEQIGDWQDIKCDQVMCELSENKGTDPMKMEMSDVSLDYKDPVDPWQSAVHVNVSCNEEIRDPSSQHGNLNPCQFLNNAKNRNQIIQESTKSVNKNITSQRESKTVEPIINPLNKAPIILIVPQKTVPIDDRKMSERAFKCTLCERCFDSKPGLRNHLRTHAAENPSLCTLCGKCFPAESDLHAHRSIHSTEKPFRCTWCEKCFRWQSYLSKHLRTHTGEKPFKCNHCGKAFAQQSQLKHHQTVHTHERPYKCTVCLKCYRCQACLNKHMRIHTGGNSYKCNECGKGFSNPTFLEYHLRMHTDENLYKCSDCGKSFSYPTSFKHHRRNQTAEKPYRCTHCGKCFSAKCALNFHLRIEKPNKCSHCGKCFAQLSHLKLHQKFHTV